MREQKPSATACLIAASLGFCSRDPNLAGLVNPLAAKASKGFMEAYGMPAALFSRVLFKSWFRPLVIGVERATIPGISLHYLLRKRYIEEKARQLLDQGIRQVVILGAGFDVLAASLHPIFPHATFLEIDYPATQAAKRKALASQHLGNNLVFVPIDFRQQTLSESLSRHPQYRQNENTLFIAEGVLMYLSQEDVNQIFAFIETYSGPKSAFIFTFMEPCHNGNVNFRNRSRLVDFWMHLRGEPFTWGIPKESMSAYLRSVGFSQEDLSTPEEFRQRYLNSNNLTQSALAEGEYVCVARRIGGPV